MSKYLSNKKLDFIAKHLEEIERSGASGIYFCFNNKKNGETAYGYLQGVWPDNDTRTGWDKRDFTFFFGDRGKRNEVFEALVKEIQDYKTVHPEVDDPLVDDPSDTGEGNGVSGILGGSTLYVVMGAAAIILILLLWDKKAK